MSDANKALAEVRAWLCDNLSSCDAGKVCGMLSVVSRHINEIESENAKLREQVLQLQLDWEGERDYADQMEAKEKQAVGENAKLRELCKDIWNDACHFDGFWDYVHDDGTIYREDELPHYQERMRKLGIEVH